MIDIRNQRFNLDLGIDPCQFCCGSNRFGKPGRHICLVKKNLSLEVIQLQKISVHDAQVADSRPCERVGNHRTKGPTPTNKRTTLAQPRLPRAAERFVPPLPSITI